MRYILLVFSVFLAQLSVAGTGGGLVTKITAHSVGGNGAGVIMFRTEDNNNKAACSTAFSGEEWAFTLETEFGRAMYSLILSAQAQQKTISVVGGDDCSVWGDRERPRYINLVN